MVNLHGAKRANIFKSDFYVILSFVVFIIDKDSIFAVFITEKYDRKDEKLSFREEDVHKTCVHKHFEATMVGRLDRGGYLSWLFLDTKLVVAFWCFYRCRLLFAFLVAPVLWSHSIGTRKDAFRALLLRNQQPTSGDETQPSRRHADEVGPVQKCKSW